MSVTPVPVRSAAEAWLQDAFAQVRRELSLFGRTFAAFVSHPARSGACLHAGDTVFMNPIGFAGSAAGAYWAAVSILAAIWPIPGADETDTLGYTTHFGGRSLPALLFVGAAMHLGLRSLGSSRSALGSLGVSFFAAGSVGAAAALLLTATARWFAHVRGTSALELSPADPVPFVLLIAAVAGGGALICTIAVVLGRLARVRLGRGQPSS